MTSTAVAPSLLAWYDRHARKLPWRVGPRERAAGVAPDPYRVWLSEVMLQQTTVAAVKPYFDAFLARWPTIADLAGAAEHEVMKAWAGLGYYSRARNLKAAADRIARDHGGRFPSTAAALRELPGVGGYTAAAIAAIAFDEPAPAVDGNIERVLARLFALDAPLPAAKPLIRARQSELMPARRAGDFVQAMMDLGAMICTPTRPACALCPIASECDAFRLGTPEAFPIKAAAAERPTRRGAAFVARRPDGAILLRRRPNRGLLGGMAEVPGSDWSNRQSEEEVGPTDWLGAAPPIADWAAIARPIVHVFTHFRLELAVFRGLAGEDEPALEGCWWASPDDLPGEALPSVMKKAIEAAFPGATRRLR